MQYVHQRRSVSPEAIPLDENPLKRRQSSRPKPVPQKKLKTKHGELEYDGPSNGKAYTPRELYHLQAQYSKLRSKLFDQWINEGLVPITRQGIYLFIKRIDNGEAMPDDWGLVGRKPIATEQEIKAKITSTLAERPGSSIGRADTAHRRVST